MIDKQNYPRSVAILKQRHALWYWLYYRVKFNKSEIAKIFGVNHTTVIRGIEAARDCPVEILTYEFNHCPDTLMAIVDGILGKPKGKEE